MATQDEFLSLVWDDINRFMQEHWIDNVIQLSDQNPDSPFSDAGGVVRRLLGLGASRRDLSLLMRLAAYEQSFSIVSLLEDPGLGEDQIDGLHENILSADPSGFEGRPGSAPARTYGSEYHEDHGNPMT